MNESLPPLDLFSPEDDVTIKRLIAYLEEFQRRREAILQVWNLIFYKFKTICKLGIFLFYFKINVINRKILNLGLKDEIYSFSL